MSVHIGAGPGDIAERVLLPGDPMRAKWIAETYLDDPSATRSTRMSLHRREGRTRSVRARQGTSASITLTS